MANDKEKMPPLPELAMLTLTGGGDHEITESPEVAAADDFEFPTWIGRGLMPEEMTEMCVADEVFFQGKILPGFITSQSISKGCSGGISRSHATNSYTSSAAAGATTPPPLPWYNYLYTHPSPTLQVRHSNSTSTASASRMSVVRGLLLMGVMKSPEIARPQGRSSGIGRNATINRRGIKQEKKASDDKKGVMRFLGRRMSCGCSLDIDLDAVAAASRGVVMAKKEGSISKRGGGGKGRSRLSEWFDRVDELEVTKEASMGGGQR